jgi:hypothetical protein
MQFGLPNLPNPFGGSDDDGVAKETDEGFSTVGGFVAPSRPERPEFKLELPNPFEQQLKLGPRDVSFSTATTHTCTGDDSRKPIGISARILCARS